MVTNGQMADSFVKRFTLLPNMIHQYYVLKINLHVPVVINWPFVDPSLPVVTSWLQNCHAHG
jgi:hypothetical protein